ncbi:MAG TPA: IS481 family transposase [Candidatus Sulfotelmatobacter sp.]
MPWKEIGIVEKRKQFVEQWLAQEWTMTELCARHGISRQAGYNTLSRYREWGWKGLEGRSRAPQRHPNQTAAELEQRIVELRYQHMRWGPRKLKAVLERRDPATNWPAVSTMGALLRREGLVIPRRKRRRIDPYRAPFASATTPNAVWCADFKGWARTQDGERIDPLTLSDACSRYLLRCRAVDKTDTAGVQAIFEAAFREYGLPQAIRTDNGAPFASRARCGLSRLSVWLIKLGIVPERIQPAHPEQNGRHERMHLTLKQETMSPMAAHRRAQQQRFDQFCREYNQLRPHEALDMQTPASCYTASPRRFPARVPQPDYPAHMQVRKVSPAGEFAWRGHRHIFLSETLIGEPIGLEPVENDDGELWYTIYFANVALARFDSRTCTVHRLPPDEDFYIEDAEEGELPPSSALHPQKPDQNLSAMSPV